jgi:tetratricopeptide (TPR) repeat protein
MLEKTSSTTSAESLYDRALQEMADGNASAAAGSFRAALSADPKYLDARHGLVRALQDANRYDEALTAAQELISLSPDDVLAYTSLSILYQHMGRIPEAEAAALKAKVLGWKHQLNNPAPDANP